MSDEQMNDSAEIKEEILAAAEASEETPDEPEEVKELTVEEQLAEANAKSAENLEGWQRARAELANARKRFEQQKIMARTNALVEISEKLLPVIDDFDLAFANVPEGITETEWYSGVELIPRKFGTILEKINIERIDSVGQMFDPNVHNAIMREASKEHETDMVIKEFQAGYKIGDRVIRPAMVAVAA